LLLRKYQLKYKSIDDFFIKKEILFNRFKKYAFAAILYNGKVSKIFEASNITIMKNSLLKNNTTLVSTNKNFFFFQIYIFI